MTVTTTTGIPELQAFLRGFSRLPARVLDDMAAVAYGTMRAGAGRHSPRPQGTGRLFQSLFRDGAGTLTQTVGHGLDAAPHAEWVILGSRPHIIEPRRAKILSWIGPHGRVFAHRVFHPGYIGDNYRDAALDDALRLFPSAVNKALGEL